MDNTLRSKLIRDTLGTCHVYIVHLGVHILDSYLAICPSTDLTKAYEASLNLAHRTTDRHVRSTRQMTCIYKSLGYSICFETVIEHLLADHDGKGIDIANELLISYEYRSHNPKQLAELIVKGQIKPKSSDTITLYRYQIPNVIEPDVSLYDVNYLDEGTFGLVMSGTWDGVPLTLKYISPEYFDPNEIGLLSQLNHPNIVKYIGSYVCKKRTIIAMERLDRKLSSCDTNRWSFEFKCEMARQLLSALSHLHDRQIMHRDLTTKNVMLTDRTLKLIDFGTAIRYVAGHEYDLRVCAEYCRAPEIFLGLTQYDLSMDIWSAGCIIWYIFKGYNLFFSEEGTLDRIYSVMTTPEYFEDLHWQIRDLVLDMLHIDPIMRISASDALIKIDKIIQSI